jgi:flavin reductase (DIM6/NTAB) family NADH-FMN oxidoreductase RutF
MGQAACMADGDGSTPGVVHANFNALMLASNASMVVVAVAHDDEIDACLVGFHAQCSILPLRYAVWLSKANHTYRLATGAPMLTVHWLHPEDVPLAAATGSVTLDEDPDKMARLRWHAAPDGSIRIDGAAGGFAGTVVARHDDGDHECFVLEPIDAWHDTSLTAGVLRFARVRELEAGHDPD